MKIREMGQSKEAHIILGAASVRATVSVAVRGTNTSEIVASVNCSGNSSKDKGQKLHCNGR